MIRKIKWKTQKTLEDLELVFTKQNGEPYNTIILAGENGTGKTTILESLAHFFQTGSIENIDYISYLIDKTPYTTVHSGKGFSYNHHIITNETTKQKKEIIDRMDLNPSKITNQENIREYGFSYTKVNSDFNAGKITSTTTLQLDSKKIDGNSNNNYTSIKQLLVDIDAQDSSEWKRVSEEGEDTTYEEFNKKSKIYRFKNSFNNFFEILKFKRINNQSTQEIEILFEKHNKDINIDNLSTGEKQIVFRGASLLKNINSISNGVVLIDEPELSMHPKWQEKILNFYRNLFSNNEIQNTQLIIATHSEYVLKSALKDQENVLIIVLEDENGIIKPKNINSLSVLPTRTSAEINYLAFGICSTDYHIELYSYLQEKLATSSVIECDDYIKSRNDIFDEEKHTRSSSYIDKKNRTHVYSTLPTYIRNAIDHPDNGNTYSQDDLEISIELLRELCRDN